MNKVSSFRATLARFRDTRVYLSPIEQCEWDVSIGRKMLSSLFHLKGLAVSAAEPCHLRKLDISLNEYDFDSKGNRAGEAVSGWSAAYRVDILWA